MHFDTSTRQRWIRVLAHSQPAALAARMNALGLTPDYDTIRAPEIGLVQIQVRCSAWRMIVFLIKIRKEI